MNMTTASRPPAPRCGSRWPRIFSLPPDREVALMSNRRSSLFRKASCLALLSATLSAAQAQNAPAEKVTIYRGEFGVPHVMADTSDAVMFGAGYAIAHDRLAAMELARHNTQGRRAELVGKAAIESDKMMRGRRLS